MEIHNEFIYKLAFPFYFFILNRQLLGKVTTSDKIYKNVKEALDMLQNQLLGDSQFLLGRSSPTVCDIYCVDMLMQLNMVGFNLDHRPEILSYINRVVDCFDLPFKDSNKIVFKILRAKELKPYVSSLKDFKL